MVVFPALITLASSGRSDAFFAENGLSRDGWRLFGVDGRALAAGAYFRTGVAGRVVPLTPAEVGCAMSHLEAYRAFLESGADVLLVYEDDARLQGPLPDFSAIFEPRADRPAMLHLGGQDGLTTRGRLHGKRVSPELDVWRVPPPAYRCLWRTCSYMLNRPAAQLLLARQELKMLNADSWRFFFREHPIDLFYSPRVAHPVHLGGSLIESERLSMTARSRLRLLFVKAVGAATLLRLKLTGHAPIHGRRPGSPAG